MALNSHDDNPPGALFRMDSAAGASADSLNQFFRSRDCQCSLLQDTLDASRTERLKPAESVGFCVVQWFPYKKAMVSL